MFNIFSHQGITVEFPTLRLCLIPVRNIIIMKKQAKIKTVGFYNKNKLLVKVCVLEQWGLYKYIKPVII